MAKLALDLALLDDPRLQKLTGSLHCSRAHGLGVLILMWAATRKAQFVRGDARELMPLLPIEGGYKQPLLRALVDSGFIVHQPGTGMFEVEGNAAHQATIEAKRKAGRKGGKAPWPEHRPNKDGKRGKGSKGPKPERSPVSLALQEAARNTWEAYREAFVRRWSIEPVRNAQVNTCIKTFVLRVGQAEAPAVVRFYVAHNDRNYIRSHHSMTLAVRDAEALYAQWKRNTPVTSLQSAMAEKANLTVDQAQRVMADQL